MGNVLLQPPFAEHPPFRLRFDGPSIGFLSAGWGIFGLIHSSVTLGQLSVGSPRPVGRPWAPALVTRSKGPPSYSWSER